MSASTKQDGSAKTPAGIVGEQGQKIKRNISSASKPDVLKKFLKKGDTDKEDTYLVVPYKVQGENNSLLSASRKKNVAQAGKNPAEVKEKKANLAASEAAKTEKTRKRDNEESLKKFVMEKMKSQRSGGNVHQDPTASSIEDSVYKHGCLGEGCGKLFIRLGQVREHMVECPFCPEVQAGMKHKKIATIEETTAMAREILAAKKERGGGAGAEPVKVCHQFQKKGTCKFGDECHFAHVAGLSPSIAKPPATKRSDGQPRATESPSSSAVSRKACFQFSSKGRCRFGEECKFSHAAAAPDSK